MSIAIPSMFLQAQVSTKSSTSQPHVKTSAALQANKLPHRLIYPGDLFYPEALAKEGVQGEVLLEIKLSKEGKASAAEIISSSKSAKLDRYALDFVNTGNYILPDNGLKYFEGNYSLNLVFVRDSILTVNSKTCADLNTDLRYFRSVRPNDNIKNLGAFELMAGLFTVQLMKNQGSGGTLKFVKAVDAINADTGNTCNRKPADLFVKTYVNSAKKRGIKF
ncbi:MAG: TonB family protein [Arenimonas sp.]